MYPNVQKILNVMSNQNVTFFIPPYQRNYEWTDEQCTVFLEDIKKTAETNRIGKKTEHFFGSITYFAEQTPFGEPSKLILIDGQQRMTTTMLFLVAIRDIVDDDNLKNTINTNYLKNDKSSENSTEYKIKLKQVESDWNVYKHIILSEEIANTEKNASVYKNYSFFKNKLLALQKDGNNIIDLLTYGLNNFSVVTLELQPDQNPWENPQEIFESMNSIGKPLSLADLVRNYLLLGLDSDTQNTYYHNYWLKIEKTISGNISNFIRDYMQCVECRPFKQATETNFKELYSQFKDIFSGMDAEKLLYELTRHADIYAYLVKGKKTGVDKIDKQLSDLKIINVTTAYSFLLYILSKWKFGELSSDDTATVLEIFKIYNYRRRILGITSSENKNFPIFTGKFDAVVKAENKYEAMFELLTNSENSMRLPNDNEMRQALQTMNFYNFKYCKYFLSLIEEKITKSRPDLTDSNLQIEHIMPRTLNDVWKKELGNNYETIQQEYLNTIGNLTLIRHNQELSNKPFEYKKKVYESKSGLQIAREHITSQANWNEASIKSRADWIIKYLLDNVLPIPDSMRLTNNFVAKEGKHLSFLELQLIGQEINFCADVTITAKVVDDLHVEFEGKKWRLSPLTKEIYTRLGTVNKSGSYQGAQHWEYDGMKLINFM